MDKAAMKASFSQPWYHSHTWKAYGLSWYFTYIEALGERTVIGNQLNLTVPVLDTSKYASPAIWFDCWVEKNLSEFIPVLLSKHKPSQLPRLLRCDRDKVEKVLKQIGVELPPEPVTPTLDLTGGSEKDSTRDGFGLPNVNTQSKIHSLKSKIEIDQKNSEFGMRNSELGDKPRPDRRKEFGRGTSLLTSESNSELRPAHSSATMSPLNSELKIDSPQTVESKKTQDSSKKSNLSNFGSNRYGEKNCQLDNQSNMSPIYPIFSLMPTETEPSYPEKASTTASTEQPTAQLEVGARAALKKKPALSGKVTSISEGVYTVTFDNGTMAWFYRDQLLKLE